MGKFCNATVPSTCEHWCAKFVGSFALISYGCSVIKYLFYNTTVASRCRRTLLLYARLWRPAGIGTMRVISSDVFLCLYAARSYFLGAMSHSGLRKVINVL